MLDSIHAQKRIKPEQAKIIRLNAADRQFNISEASISLAVGQILFSHSGNKL